MPVLHRRKQLSEGGPYRFKTRLPEPALVRLIKRRSRSTAGETLSFQSEKSHSDHQAIATKKG